MARWGVLTVAAALTAIALAACGGSNGGKTAAPTVAGLATVPAATPTEDANTLATRAAGSAAAKLIPAVLSMSDYPPDFEVKRQQTRIMQASDVPGLPSEASAFFATIATKLGDEFVSLIAIATDGNAAASAVFDAFTPGPYLAGLTGGATDATTSTLDVAGAPAGAKGFRYSGTIPASSTQPEHPVSGEALAFVQGTTFVIVVHGSYAPSTRGIDVVKIANAVEARLKGS